MNKSKILFYTALVFAPLAAMDNDNDNDNEKKVTYYIKLSPTQKINNENIKKEEPNYEITDEMYAKFYSIVSKESGDIARDKMEQLVENIKNNK